MDTHSSSSTPSDTLILVGLPDLVLFPGMVVPVSADQAGSAAALQEAARQGRPLAVALQREGRSGQALEDLHGIGTEARLLRYVTSPDGRTHTAILQGVGRVRLLAEAEPGSVRVERLPDAAASASTELAARMHRLREQALEALRLIGQAPPELIASLQGLEEPGPLADTVAALIDVTLPQKQEILETLALPARLDRVLWHLAYRLEVLRLSADIGRQTRETMEGRQREFMLREQLKTIQKELGEGDEQGPEVAALREKLTAAGMPEDVEKQAMRELRRLERMPEGSGEAGMVRSYLETLAELPWTLGEAAAIDIARARAVLEEEHHGLEKIKRRILEFLAVRKLNPEGRSPILCFVGPPGVGKTSLGQSIAHALDRPFVRVSLGGVHDEAEIRGHRRTYVGALPGNIIQGIRRAGARDGVMLLDEIDKLGGGGFQGDPASAMLEVLDPEQNSTFRDAYLGVPFDLSRVLFIATANQLDTIPGPLRDRMEIVELSGYTAEEKQAIARRYLVPRQLKQNGLATDQAALPEDTLTRIVEDYTREAGVRGLEREIGAVLRSAAMRVAEGEATPIPLPPEALSSILGPSRFDPEVAGREAMPGVVTGLAWTPVGGSILFVESTRVPGSGRLILTGQLGDVMKESVQAALTLVKGRADKLGIDPAVFERSDIHVHVPAGATPKDGPSAGVAMFLSLSSLLLGRPVEPAVAMTGEVSLRGLVLPVGGIREKVTAAARAGITTVMLPARNKRDWDDIPASVKAKLRFVWLETVDDALAETLPPEALPRAAVPA
ncbi:endopeptidase La [Pseudoroseomonas deserti]|uniref:Lon protease n=1 Tax=Teichococcus deserti TaxID=1817963 RepID=A0A1V2H424_9PROT|nr:endopeptidase La [Pseudoroseomonas deserti]ONG55774.1 endopeptidase La [Pseudoroseomonas deserti]